MMIDYKGIEQENRTNWKAMTDNPEKYETLVAGHYSDNNHFIYELLQNADDANATKIIFQCYDDKLVVYHNGDPFTNADVIGVCSFLEGTKDKHSAQKIGHFGLGFKSVFKYTTRPEIYSNDEAFAIESYLLPKELPNKINRNKCIYTWGEEQLKVFNDTDNMTKFILPYKSDIIDETSSIKVVDVAQKLFDLEPQILLFLRALREIRWIDYNDKDYGSYTLDCDELNEGIKICSKFYSGSERIKSSDEQLSYLLFSKTVPHDSMKNATVSIAYLLNKTRSNIEPTNNSKIWVFFPTGDESGAKLLMHGSYETPVSREKIMHPSAFNDYLISATEDLIIESLYALKKEKLLTQKLIKEILLPSCESHLLSTLREKLTKAFTENEYLPVYSKDSEDGEKFEYSLPKDCLIPILTDIYKHIPLEKLAELRGKDYMVVHFTDYYNSKEYIKWLKDDLNVDVLGIGIMAELLKEYGYLELNNYKEYCADNMLDYLEGYIKKQISASFSNMTVEDKLKEFQLNHPNLISNLKKANIIKIKTNEYVAYDDCDKLFIGAENDYIDISDCNLVDLDFSNKYLNLLSIVSVEKFDNMHYLKNYILNKYTKDTNNISEESHIQDMKNIIKILDEAPRRQRNSIINTIQNCYLFRTTNIKDDNTLYCGINTYEYECNYNPPEIFASRCNGYSMTEYFSGTNQDVLLIDVDFYEQHDITENQLIELGVNFSIIIEGDNSGDHYNSNSGKDPKWYNIDNFKYDLTFYEVESVLIYINNNHDHPSAKQKSKIIFNILLQCIGKITGKINVKNNDIVAESQILEIIKYGYVRENKSCLPHYTIRLNRNNYHNNLHNNINMLSPFHWLYTKDGDIVSASEITKYDLDPEIYGDVKGNNKIYEILGFQKSSEEKVDSVKSKLDKLIRDLSPEEKSMFYSEIQEEVSRFYKLNFTPPTYQFDGGENVHFALSIDFPTYKIRNLDRLKISILQSLTEVDPVKYEQRLRSVRTSKNNKRTYLSSMYKSHINNTHACQMCKNFGGFEAVQIERNPKYELDQMHLCMCSNCTSQYGAYQRNDKIISEFMNNIKSWGLEEIAQEDEPISVSLTEDISISFTQTHLAEIVILLENMDKAGIDINDSELSTV